MHYINNLKAINNEQKENISLLKEEIVKLNEKKEALEQRISDINVSK